MEYEKYNRQIKVNGFGVEGQTHLANARILVVGAGGLGAACLPYFAGAGIGHISIMDADVIELSNLHRQVIYNEADVGKYKAEVVKTYLLAQNSQISVECILDKIGAHNAQKLASDFDLIVDCTDNYNAKYAINDACIAADIPMFSASIEGMSGYLGVFGGQGFANYRALFHEPALNALNCADSGVLGTVAGVFGLMQAQEVIKFLSGAGEVLKQVVMLDLYDVSMRKIDVAENYVSEFKPFAVVDLETVQDEQLLDVRELNEFETAHHLGAMHYPLSAMRQNEAQPLNLEKQYVIYCAKGTRAENAAIRLQRMGLKKVALLSTGLG